MSADGHEAMVLGNGLKYKVQSKGTGTHPSSGDLVLIAYNTFIGNGTPVEKNTRLSFVLGKDQTIEALDRGVAKMALGETANITATPEFTYGTRGLKPFYGADDSITFQVTLLENLGPFDIKANLPLVSRLTLADSLRERGNFLYVRNEDMRAIHAYKTALKYMFEHPHTYTTSREEDCQLGDFIVKTYNNLAAAYLKVENYKEADRCATMVVQLDQTNAKGLYRKGMALKGLGDYEVALCFLQCALQAEPASDKIRLECCSVAALIECGKKNEPVQSVPEQCVQANDQPKELEDVHQDGEKTAENDTKTEDIKTAEVTPVNEAKEEKKWIPSWMKWAAGAAAVVGTGLLIYKIFK